MIMAKRDEYMLISRSVKRSSMNEKKAISANAFVLFVNVIKHEKPLKSANGDI